VNISEFKNNKSGRTWQDMSDMFDVPLMRLYRWSREGHQVRRIGGKMVIVKVVAVEQEQESA
jgi:hypothetical protein